jgi:hypothetical protein
VVLDAVTFAEHAGRAALNVGTSTGVNWAADGGQGSDVLTQAGLSIAASTAGSYGAMHLGRAYGNGHIDFWTHKVEHAALGAATGAISSPKNPWVGAASGASGIFIGEIAMEAYAGHQFLDQTD